ncbi:hypothetical protein SKAU_G00252420 [Synaphobranchus kaupii]|uniref:Uncharacterized protein n=1 Tax=Synaphobranchus kaupii TaxID=118154 RepID=A0A9Q1F333_SYNKA|nr:hypothetical protein SKAU_G00252420 [Synaphobranchus kaupii]
MNLVKGTLADDESNENCGGAGLCPDKPQKSLPELSAGEEFSRRQAGSNQEHGLAKSSRGPRSAVGARAPGTKRQADYGIDGAARVKEKAPGVGEVRRGGLAGWEGRGALYETRHNLESGSWRSSLTARRRRLCLAALRRAIFTEAAVSRKLQEVAPKYVLENCSAASSVGQGPEEFRERGWNTSEPQSVSAHQISDKVVSP